LQGSYRREYVVMIATAYAVDGDLEAARERIADLGESGEETLFSLTLDTIILQPEQEVVIGRLARLATDLGLSSPAMEPFLESPVAEPTDGA
jgi:hypothetical protein